MSVRLPWSKPPEFKKCRYCFVEIPGEAEVCPCCGETVVRVRPAMVKTLIAVFLIGFLLLAGQSLLWRTTMESSRLRDVEFKQGLEMGLKIGARQAREDAAGNPMAHAENLPARFETFLRDKSAAFRTGFESGYVRAYHHSRPAEEKPATD